MKPLNNKLTNCHISKLSHWLIFTLVNLLILTACSKDKGGDDSNPPVPHFILKFDKQQVAQRKAGLKVEIPKGIADAFIDLNGNLKQDAGEGLESKYYSITTDVVNIISDKIEQTGLSSKQLISVEILDSYPDEILNIYYCTALTSVKVTYAPRLGFLQLYDNPDLTQVIFPTEPEKIAELQELDLQGCDAIKNRLQLFQSLPNRKGKIHGTVYLTKSPTEEEARTLGDLGWGIVDNSKN